MSFKDDLKIEDVAGLSRDITIASEHVPVGRGINARLHLFTQVHVVSGSFGYRLEFGKDKWDFLTLEDAIDEYNEKRKSKDK